MSRWEEGKPQGSVAIDEGKSRALSEGHSSEEFGGDANGRIFNLLRSGRCHRRSSRQNLFLNEAAHALPLNLNGLARVQSNTELLALPGLQGTVIQGHVISYHLQHR